MIVDASQLPVDASQGFSIAGIMKIEFEEFLDTQYPKNAMYYFD